jgi:hypothetical protein
MLYHTFINIPHVKMKFEDEAQVLAECKTIENECFRPYT